MNARHVEERREIFMGQELVYFVTVFEPLPEASQEGPYCDEGRCVFARDSVAQTPASSGRLVHPGIERPSKAEYVRAFEAAGELPACVVERMGRVYGELREIARYFDLTLSRMPCRLRNAIGRFDGTLAAVYDTGTLGRIRWHFDRHRRRWDRACLADIAWDPGFATV